MSCKEPLKCDLLWDFNIELGHTVNINAKVKIRIKGIYKENDVIFSMKLPDILQSKNRCLEKQTTKKQKIDGREIGRKEEQKYSLSLHTQLQSALGLVLIQCLLSHTQPEACLGDDGRMLKKWQVNTHGSTHPLASTDASEAAESQVITALVAWRQQTSNRPFESPKKLKRKWLSPLKQFPKINALEIDLFKTIANSSILTCFVFGH